MGKLDVITDICDIASALVFIAPVLALFYRKRILYFFRGLSQAIKEHEDNDGESMKDRVKTTHEMAQKHTSQIKKLQRGQKRTQEGTYRTQTMLKAIADGMRIRCPEPMPMSSYKDAEDSIDEDILESTALEVTDQ